MGTSSLSTPVSVTPSRASIVLSLLGAMLIGSIILFGTAFSQMNVAHNAAHDMRHANGFPCH